MAEQQIGTVKRRMSRYVASCGFARCGWYIEKSTEAEAEQTLRGHANLVHPQPKAIFR